MNYKWKAYIDLTLAMFISGSAVVVSKMMVNDMPPFLITEIGILIGLIVLLFHTFVIKKEHFKLDLKTYLVLFAQAICGIFLYRIFTLLGLSYTSATNSGLITSTSPAMVVILAYFILKEKIRLKGFIGLLFVLMGLFTINMYSYLVGGSAKNSLFGNLLIMAAVICEALFSVLSKIECKRMTALYRTTIIVIFAFICLLPFSIKEAYQYDFKTMAFKTGACLVYYGVCVSYLSYVFWFRGIEKVNASEAAPFTSMVPVSSILLAALLLKESISLIHVIGMLFIIFGILISSVPASNKIEKLCKVKS
ncbi:MAG: DMT family transporter [Anaerocolumna sp.]